MIRNADIDIAAVIRERLDVDRLLVRLTAWDCQSCQKRIGRSRTAMVVQAGPLRGIATVHHASCARSAWIEVGPDDDLPAANATYASHNTVFYRGADSQPLLVINPSLECAALERDSDSQGWSPTPSPVFLDAGMITTAQARSDAALGMRRPPSRVRGQLSRDASGPTVAHIGVDSQYGRQTYDMALNTACAADIAARGFSLLLITPHYEPGAQIDAAEYQRLAAQPDTVRDVIAFDLPR